MTGRLLVAAGGLSGAAGVALSAMAAHAGGANTTTAATFLLFHAPALLVLGLADAGRVARIGGAVLAVGLVLFAGDLLARDLAGDRLFPYSAPAGGLLLIAGWLAVGASALFPRGLD
ncbi:MAG: DUF423 domain-containing protein [Rhizobiaceae bacterium]|nr:DUF423 domain-containing protein [Rhizobiaceae bacterium]